MNARWAHVTYASFRNSDGRGGWHAGPSVNASDRDRQLVGEYAPTSLVPIEPFDDFIGAAEIEALPRRFEYLPVAGHGLFMQSVPAGKDATGRPGNVFTHAVIDHELSQPMNAIYPINLYQSPDLRTPFRAARVNNVTLAGDLAEPASGPLADLDVAWMMVLDMLGDRRGALHRLQDVLAEGRQLAVLAIDNTNEAAYWLQALSSTLSPLEARRLLRFSTFDRGGALPISAPMAGTYPVIVVPTKDRPMLARHSGIAVIDPADPVTFAGDPVSTWARLSNGIFGRELKPKQIVRALIGTEEKLRANPGGGLRPGDGLAHLVSTRPELGNAWAGDGTLGEVARQHLSRELSGADQGNRDLALIRGVIAKPRSAIAGGNWPVLKVDELRDREYSELIEQSRDGFGKLRQADADEIIAYLDFLLRTGLMKREQLGDQTYRAQFNDIPALHDRRSQSLPTDSHPLLRDVLDLVAADERDRQRKPQAPVREPERKRPARHRRSAEQVLRQLDRANSIPAIWAWLAWQSTPEQLHLALAEKIIDRAESDYSGDLLRVYYSLVCGTHQVPDEARVAVAKLTAVAVRHAAEHGAVELGDYITFGREIVAPDFQKIFPEQRSRDRAIAVLEGHQSPKSLNLAEPSAEIYAAVARGILGALRPKPAQARQHPAGPRRRSAGPRQTRKDTKK